MCNFGIFLKLFLISETIFQRTIYIKTSRGGYEVPDLRYFFRSTLLCKNISQGISGLSKLEKHFLV